MLQAKEVETSEAQTELVKTTAVQTPLAQTKAVQTPLAQAKAVQTPKFAYCFHSRKGVASMVTITFPLLWKLRNALHCNMAFALVAFELLAFERIPFALRSYRMTFCFGSRLF